MKHNKAITNRIALTLCATIAITLLTVSAEIATAGEKVSFKRANIEKTELNTTLSVPIQLDFKSDLTAIDIPLEYSEGVELISVDLGEELSGFEFTSTQIDKEARTVVIAGIRNISGAFERVNGGSGIVAALNFRVIDESAEMLTVNSVKLTEPEHQLWLVYNDYSESGAASSRMETPQFEGVEVQLSTISEDVSVILPTQFALSQNYPNPFNPTTTISYALPQRAHVELEIYNVLGQNVATILDSDVDAGEHKIVWDGRDERGIQTASGVYFYRLTAGDFVQSRKMVLLK